MPALQGVYWMLTVPQSQFIPYLPRAVAYSKGQLEVGAGGFLHWQLIVVFERSVRLGAVREIYGPVHCELTRSEAALEYVWKEETAVPGTRFELGRLKTKRNCKRDWDQVWQLAKEGKLEEIDKSVLVCHYRSIKSIRQDNLVPSAMERRVKVFWGATGTGKSRTAWEEAGVSAYPKDPRTKFWDGKNLLIIGYTGQENVVIDEFRGAIDIAHMLRWFDRYPIIVEVKGSSVVLEAKNIWVTSNLSPEAWYPDCDSETLSALRRRLEVTRFLAPL